MDDTIRLAGESAKKGQLIRELQLDRPRRSIMGNWLRN